MIVCSNCGTENKPGRKFCSQCATPLLSACPTCGAHNDPGDRFCGQCASPLPGAVADSAPTAASTSGAPVAERRLVSVLFADLVGFTPFAEERDAEDVRETLSRYFDVASEVIGRYGGTVEKFIGDAVMALWGAPVAHEDDAERAVRAALDLVEAVKGLGSGIAARAGVLTGEAAVTLGATNQGMVAGDLVNTAARLQSVAAPGTVLVGDATMHAASQAIVFEPAGEHALKGKAAPLAAWRAVRVVAEVGGRNRNEAFEAPFVGRDEELRQVKDHFHSTGRDRRARLVSVIGPAGIGKSRLAWEFSKYIDGLVENVWWHDGRSPAYGDGISFWALGEMVRGRAGLLETDDEATTRAKVASTVEEHVPDPGERAWIERALLALLGVGAGTGSEELFGAWRTFFERLASTGSVVLVFEDFHHADPGLVAFVDHVLEWSKGVPIYIVTLARPEFLAKHSDWGAGKRSFISIHLDPLSDDAMRELLDGLVPGLPDALVTSIVRRADGIPLYAVEIVRMLLASGKVSASEGAYLPTADLSVLAVPETLTALIASRLDMLSADERSLVSDAAALGQSFTPAALASVSGRPESELEGLLRALVRREFLTLQVDPRSPELGQYAFVQALIREVAYNTLAKRDRKARHLAAARFFEGLGTDELAGATAGHYLAAYRNSSDEPEADVLRARARVALDAAAERAIVLGSHEQAVSFLSQALGLATDQEDRAGLLERAAMAATTAGRHEIAEQLARQAIGIRQELGKRASLPHAFSVLARALSNSYRSKEAIGVLETAIAEVSDLDDDPSLTELLAQLARAYFLTDQGIRAVAIADQVLERAERANLGDIIADTLVTKGAALGDLGRAVEGIALVRAGGVLAQGLGLFLTATRASVNLGMLELSRDPASALQITRDGLSMTRRLGLRATASGMLNNAGLAALRTGEWSWAIAELESALVEELEQTDRSDVLEILIAFRALRGLPVADSLTELLTMTEASTDPRMSGARHNATGFVAFADGSPADAAESWRQLIVAYHSSVAEAGPRIARAALWSGSVDEAREARASLDTAGIHGPAMTADRMTIDAGLAAMDGRRSEAMELYRDAIGAWRELGLPWDEALCGIDMAMLLDPADPEVAAAAEAARGILQRLEARPFIDMLDTATSAGSTDAAQRATTAAGPLEVGAG